MRLHRVYVDLPFRNDQQLRLPDPAARHLVQVLRLRVGDPLVVFNGDGRDYSAQVESAQRAGGVRLRVGAAGEAEPAPALEIHLGLGISKGERMDFSLQKSVELGVSSIAPLFTGRSVVRLSGERLARRAAHWQGVIIAACEQSGRRRLPELHSARGLDTWLDQPHPSPLLLDHRGDSALPDLAPPGNALTLLVGPEGGLSGGERQLARRAGFRGVRLGPRILRTETAPLAALAIVQALWGDLRGLRESAEHIRYR
jgi:16S rRNA (uracil1498-N3)-methyltransferase